MDYSTKGIPYRILTCRVEPIETHGPIAEYDERVISGRLRDDEHQRGM